MTLQAYRFALNPSPAQERALRSHCGAARVAFSWGLARVTANLGQREAGRSCGIIGDDLTPVVGWSLYSLRKDWNAAKGDVAPWWPECSREAFSTGPGGLARALGNWQGSGAGKRKGGRAGFPRFRSRRGSRLSCRFTTGAVRCEARHVVLPRLGRIRLHEDAASLAGKVEAGTARILPAAVRAERGRWFVSFTCQVQRTVRAPVRPDAVVGVDLGIRALAVLPAGEAVPDPRHLSGALRKVRRLSRTVSRRRGPCDPEARRRQVPSRRWRRAAAALGEAQGRVADQRRDSIRKLTTRLSRQYGTVVAEDLNVAGMLKNRRVARHIADASFGEIRRQLGYKTAWNGGRLIVADRWYPSSKTCSGCGAVKARLALSERTYACTACGLVLDRDENAARNLAALSAAMVAGSAPETLNGRGANPKTGPARQVAAKRQPGTAPAGQPGTVSRQQETAKVSTHAH